MTDSGFGSDHVRRRLAWGLPVVVAGAVAAGVVVSSTNASGASPKLPPRTAAQLLVAVQSHTATALSGRFTEKADLGIPSLPGGRDSASLSWQTFVSGSHSAKVWVDGADKQRVALLGQLSEADVVHNGNDVWTYTSDSNTVTHSTLNHHAGADTKSAGEPSAADLTPTAIADHVLKAISPSTAVGVDASRTVAGRAAYTLVLRPRDSRSTVSKVTIALDAKKFVPLQVRIYGSGSTPAFQAGFTSISFAKPAASVFRFHPPAGATVAKDPFGTHSQRHTAKPAHMAKPGLAHGQRPVPANAAAKPGPVRTLGTGWTTIVELPKGAANGLAGGALHDLTSPVGSTGAQLLHTALVNAVITSDGRAFVGAVSPAYLEHVAATTR